VGLHRWLDRAAERRQDRWQRVLIEIAQSRRGTHLFPEVGLPDGFEPPSAALRTRGLDVLAVAAPVPSDHEPGSPPEDYDG